MHSHPLSPGVGIGRLADLRLLRVVELAAARQRQEVEAGARERHGEVPRIVEPAAARDDLVGEETTTDDEARTDARADGLEHLEGQPDTRVARSAVSVAPVVTGREKPRHGVRVRVVQLDAVEAGGFGAGRGGGENLRKHARQIAHRRLVHVGHALAIAVVQRLELACVEDAVEIRVAQ